MNIKNISHRMIIRTLIHRLGISACLAGCRYLCYAIDLAIADFSVTYNVMQLYAKIAKVYDTTPSRVERAIRHAIETGWLRGDQQLQEEIFGHTIDANKGKPTNHQFICDVAEYLIILGDDNKQ